MTIIGHDINKMWDAIFNIWENPLKQVSQQIFILTTTYIGDIYLMCFYICFNQLYPTSWNSVFFLDVCWANITQFQRVGYSRYKSTKIDVLFISYDLIYIIKLLRQRLKWHNSFFNLFNDAMLCYAVILTLHNTI